MLILFTVTACQQVTQDGWISFFGALISAVIGGLIAGYVASDILNKQITNEKNKEEYIKVDERNKELEYFKVLLQDIIILVGEQIDEMKKHLTKMESDPYNIHVLSFITMQDIGRVGRLDQKRLFHAYIDRFGHTSPIINQYKNIISMVDYFGEANVEVEKIQDRYSSNMKKSLYDIQSDVDKLISDSANYMNQLKIEHQANIGVIEIYHVLNGLILNYHDKKPNSHQIEGLYYNFLEPFGMELMTNFNYDPVAVELGWRARNLIRSYNEIRKHSTNEHSNLKTYMENISDAKSKLEKLSNVFINKPL